MESSQFSDKSQTPEDRARMTPDRVARTVIAELIPGRGYLATLAVIGVLFLVGVIFLFYCVEDKIYSQKEYILTQRLKDENGEFIGFSDDKIHFFQQTATGLSKEVPPWMIYDIREDMLQLANIQNEFQKHSILEWSLISRMHGILQNHPWVRRVISIKKYYPARLDVVLEYRRPILMVEKYDPQTRQVQAVIPMDRDAYVLVKSDIPEPFLKSLPILKDCDTGLITTAAGNYWNNIVGQEAAKIIADFGDEWQKLNLSVIRPVQIEEPKNNFVNHFYLETRTGGVVDFGRMSSRQEPYSTKKTKQKVQLLLDYLQEYKTLDRQDGQILRFQ